MDGRGGGGEGGKGWTVGRGGGGVDGREGRGRGWTVGRGGGREGRGGR